MDYFLQKDIDDFTNLANKLYNKNDPEDKLGGHFVRTKIFDKVTYWGKLVANELGYDVLPNNSWLKPYLSHFREYAWCRIFPDENNKQLFFNVEVNTEESSLIIKMDCKFSGTDSLDPDRIKLFRKYIDDKKYIGQCVRWFVINIKDYNSFSDLVQFSKEFIQENLHHFDEVKRLLNSPDLNEAIEDVKLEKINPSKIKLNEVLNDSSNQSFSSNEQSYQDKTHNHSIVEEPHAFYAKRNLENKKLGDFGEQLARLKEQQKLNDLINKGIIPPDKKVIKQKDLVGFDFLSFDSNGEELHIEVKTTRGKKNTPFYMSYNEVLVMENDPKWRLYRIFNLDSSNEVADYFVWDKSDMLLNIDFLTKSYYCKIK